MANHKKMTVKYWNSLDEDTRYTALRILKPSLLEAELRYRAKRKVLKDDYMWDIIQNLKIPADNSYYKVVFVRETFIV